MTAERRPNVIVVMTDQQRADFLAAEGFGLDTMPFYESLFAEGVRFPGAYTPMPICTPARVSMLTGRFPKAHGMIGNWPSGAPRYARDLPETLREHGYELALFGKNHSHATEDDFDVWRPYMHTSGPPRPGSEALDQAFDRWLVNLAHWVSDEPTPFPLECQYPVRIVSDAIEWLRGRTVPAAGSSGGAERPFFALVSFPEPHSPYQVPEPYYSLFPPEHVPPPVAGPEALAQKNPQWRAQYEAIRRYHPRLDEQAATFRSRYCGMLRLIDDQLRRLVTFLRETGELERTIVVYLADHGEFCGDYGLFRKGLALPQVCIRVPMLWFGGPVMARGVVSPALVSIVDIFPTLCEALGIPFPAGVQGRSLWPLLQGDSLPHSLAEFRSVYAEIGIGGKVVPPPTGGGALAAETVFIDGVPRTNLDGTITAMSGYRRAVIMGDWKLVYDLELPLELYHLASDPYELHNRAADPSCAAPLRELMEELTWWSVRLDDNLDVRRYAPVAPPHNWYRQ